MFIIPCLICSPEKMVLDILDAGNDVEAVWAAGQRVQASPQEDGAH